MTSLKQKSLYKKLKFILNGPDMFTGIIQDLGEIVEIQPCPEGKRFWIRSTMKDSHFSTGNSIAVDGVCLTVEEFKDGAFRATAVEETLRLTTLSQRKPGDHVNLEAPLTLETPIAGHLVSGHIDAQGEVKKSGSDFQIQVPDSLLKYMAKKGSLTVNGVSLTIAEVEGNVVRIALIPETLKKTNLGQVQSVNLEVDLLARYVERLHSSSQ